VGHDDGTAARPDGDERADLARDVASLEAFSRVFRRVAALARPSVVSIQVQSRAAPRRFAPADPDDLFRRFFGEAPLRAPAAVEVSSGTGVILDRDGTVLTNNHVAGAEGAEIQVTLQDGRTFRGSVKGRDPKTDLALVQIESPPDDLVPAVLGRSSSLEVGDWVIAVGSPFGLQQTVTAGIVSAKGRADVGITEFEDFIQTDAALNPGNSGGPLLNLRGEVIGINTAIASRSGGFMGIGFAIPIDIAREVARQLGATGRVVRGWLGVAIRDVTPDERTSLGLGGRTGVYVSQVTDDSPAARAGLREGDVILGVRGEATSDVRHLRTLIADAGAGQTVSLEVWRGGASSNVDVTLGTLPDEQPQALRSEVRPAPGAAPGPGGPVSLGVRARALTPDLAKQYGLAPDAAGVVITAVQPGSLAAQTGVQPGWIIRAIDGQTVSTLDDLDAAVKRLDVARGVQLQLEGPGGARSTVFVQHR
jgi:serine protease Do